MREAWVFRILLRSDELGRMAVVLPLPRLEMYYQLPWTFEVPAVAYFAGAVRISDLLHHFFCLVFFHDQFDFQFQ